MDAVKTLNYIQFMKPLEERTGFYAVRHREARNRAPHFAGAPTIIVSGLY